MRITGGGTCGAIARLVFIKELSKGELLRGFEYYFAYYRVAIHRRNYRHNVMRSATKNGYP